MFSGAVRAGCRASVVVPARNEEGALRKTLERLCGQLRLDGSALDWDEYEVLLLLNNCTDGSAEVARAVQAEWPGFALHVEDCSLPGELAHVGTARRLLMDAACARMESVGGQAVLSTDADTLVARDWVAANLRELELGAEVVGGAIALFAEDYEALEPGVRAAYERDRRYQELVAELESRLDPVECDPWPRHLQHFGASLGCTCAVYRRAGGLPAVKPLEDVAFVHALRGVGARIRHAPGVRIETSARMEGRAEVGLSGQLRHWANDVATGAVHDVESAEWLAHRFGALSLLRGVHARGAMGEGTMFEADRERVEDALGQGGGVAEFLRIVDCDGLMERTFRGAKRGEICAVIAELERVLGEDRR